ncbi:hypothetical protein NQ318_017387 [Aromia moschata]|uniref:Uncharacterized protein n=1 Tax=Aromia moschata TaxID=1265417 RepID=A0AAV8Z4Y6_9CUCU|nr:hypothetical protein NQ318_017387 [Aromia moschata]
MNRKGWSHFMVAEKPGSDNIGLLSMGTFKANCLSRKVHMLKGTANKTTYKCFFTPSLIVITPSLRLNLKVSRSRISRNSRLGELGPKQHISTNFTSEAIFGWSTLQALARTKVHEPKAQ